MVARACGRRPGEVGGAEDLVTGGDVGNARTGRVDGSGPILEDNRAVAQARSLVIASTPALRERALAKAEALNLAVAAALHERGLPESLALLAAQIGMAAFGHAAREWRTGPSRDLHALLVQSFGDIQTLG
jgi:hypothetical protein